MTELLKIALRVIDFGRQFCNWTLGIIVDFISGNATKTEIAALDRRTGWR